MDKKLGESLITACTGIFNTEGLIMLINSPEYTKEVINYSSEFHTPLSMACTHNRPEVVEALIKKGADVNHLSKEGMTPLMLNIYNASYYNEEERAKSLETIQILIDNKADIHIKGRYSAFSLACGLEKLEIVRFLLDHDVDIEFKDVNGKTGLDYLKNENNIEGIKLIESYILHKNLKNNLDEHNTVNKKHKI
jgi:ankyrin repeat protein